MNTPSSREIDLFCSTILQRLAEHWIAKATDEEIKTVIRDANQGISEADLNEVVAMMRSSSVELGEEG